jgi:hypothetical protein
MKTVQCLVSVMVLSLFGLTAVAQESRASSLKPARKSQAGLMFDQASQDATMRPAIRLPRYFSSLVTGEQREAIYRIQADYGEREQHLQEQLAMLRAEELAACEQVLNEMQRSRLEELRTAAMERVRMRSSAMNLEALESTKESRPASEGKAEQREAIPLESDTE